MTLDNITIRLAFRQAQTELPPVGLPSDQIFVRVLHELELAANLPHTTPADRPEVRALFPNHFVPFGKNGQLLAWQMNPLLSAGNMTAVYHNALWICNGQGFGDSTDPRANWFENTNYGFDLPKVEALTCGGNLLHVTGEAMVKTNAGLEDCWLIETLDYHTTPTLEFMDAHPWLVTWAVNMSGSGLPRRFSQGTQPNGYVPGVRHPLVADPSQYTIAIQKWRCVRWMESFVPDSYKVYIER
jgi:hypothetical protein